MKKRISFLAIAINMLLALVISMPISANTGLPPVETATAIVVVSASIQYFVPDFFVGKLLAGLQTEVWVAGIKENPIPSDSFVAQSTDMSMYVNHNKLHLAEAGIEPSVYEDYFSGNENPLPIVDITDIPNEVVLKTYSTDQTRHRQLQDVELQYDKRSSILNRHRRSLAKNLAARAAFSWSPSADDAYNKILNLAANDSVIDALIDLEAFFADLDVADGLNICLNAQHMARIKKEDKNLYKDILNEKQLYSFKVFRLSKQFAPLYLSDGTKKPFGTVADATDKRASFVWATDEVFRCFGDVEMYANLRDSGIQADTISFAQRALVGKIRANSPKYLGAIL